MAVTIDFETRSRCDLKTAGAVKYSEDPSTEIQCLCIADEAGAVHTLYRRDTGLHGDLDKVLRASNIVAHNAEFELAIWNNVGVKRLGWPELPLHKLDCTAARAAMCSLPRNLEGACDALGLPVSKDRIGCMLMLKMCKPQANGAFRDNPGDLDALVSYCRQDCLAEAALDQALPPLPVLERAVWQYNVAVNLRGARIDRAGIEAVIRVLEEDGKMKLSEFQRLTKGHVMSPRQVAKLLAYLEEYDVKLPDLSKNSVAKAIESEENEDIKAILEIRRSLGKASVSKYLAAIKAASADDRMRGLFMYHGAGTGRWTANRFQPHNLVRDVLPDAGKFFETCKQGLEVVKNAYPDEDIVSLASRAGRAMVIPAEGKSFYVGDFAAIEGRGLAWLAGEKWVLDAYIAGKDMYRINAATIYHIPAESIPKESPKRQVGKVIELACLAGDTLVLTDSGWRCLGTVTILNKVWDGVEFVMHDGLVLRGERVTLSNLGITATPDHKFLTRSGGEETWTSWEDLSACTLTQSLAISMASLPFYESLSDTLEVSYRFDADAVVALKTMFATATYYEAHQEGVTLVQNVRQVQLRARTPDSSPKSVDDISSTEYRRWSQDAQSRPTASTRSTAAGESKCIKNGWPTGQSFFDTYSPSPAGKIQVSRSIASTTSADMNREISGSSPCKNSSTIQPETVTCSTTGRNLRQRSFINCTAQATPELERSCESLAKDFRVTRLSPNSQKCVARTKVYDLKNCGRRSRFTILTVNGPMIVHNCGYQGWVNAFHAMAKGYGVHIPDDEAAEAISAWRKSRPMTVAYWKRIGDAALQVAASNNTTCNPVGHVIISLEFVNGIRFMTIRLPSGRKLWYCNPSVVTATIVYEDGRTQVRDEIHFWGVDSKTRRWGEQRTYSGCLVENITQAVCRDLLAASMFRAEMYGFQTVLHVHDEIVAEAPKSVDVKLFERVMSEAPSWAAGLPMKVEAKQMERYGK